MSFSVRYPGWIPSAFILLTALAGCAPEASLIEVGEAETLSRTEFTDRIENFFEYTPLRAGEPSAFLIHLTDLTDGTPVAQAQVELSVRSAGIGNEVTSVVAQVGRVTGIYVAEVTVPASGTYDIQFRIRNEHLDEEMLVDGFGVEE